MKDNKYSIEIITMDKVNKEYILKQKVKDAWIEFNKSDKNRFHIIAHANYNDDFCKLFVESFEKNYEPIYK